jgi:hypothetical protein
MGVFSTDTDMTNGGAVGKGGTDTKGVEKLILEVSLKLAGKSRIGAV